MWRFNSRSNDDREKSQHRTDSRGVFKRSGGSATTKVSTATRLASNTSSILKNNLNSRTDSETDPNMTMTDSENSHECSKGAFERHRTADNHPSLVVDSSHDSSASERDDDDLVSKRHQYTSKQSSGSRRSRRSKRRSRGTTPSLAPPVTSSMLPFFGSNRHQIMGKFQDQFRATPMVNPFANKGEVYLCEDMATVCDALKLDLNTQVMLAYYDAKTLEDFCLLAEADLKDLISKAQAMRRAIPPLQIRKIEVLREWVQELAKPRDESRIPAWLRLAQPKRRRKSKSLIPDDWKEQFRRDLPTLKHNLRKKGAGLSGFPIFIPSFQSITMCGMVE